MPKSVPLNAAAVDRIVAPFAKPFVSLSGGAMLQSKFGAYCQIALEPTCFLKANFGKQFDASKRELTLFVRCDDTDIEEHLDSVERAAEAAATRELGRAPSSFTGCLSKKDDDASVKICLNAKTKLTMLEDDGGSKTRTALSLDDVLDESSELRRATKGRLRAFVKVFAPTVWAKKMGNQAGVKVKAARVTFAIVEGDDDDSSSDSDDNDDLNADLCVRAAKKQRRE